jgi:hypothetical protein
MFSIVDNFQQNIRVAPINTFHARATSEQNGEPVCG